MLLIILFVLLVMAVQDYRTGLVSNCLFLPLLLFIKWSLGLVLLFVVLLALFQFIISYIGGADLKLFMVFAGIFEVNDLLIWLTLAFGIALLYALLLKKQSIRMFPFFLLAYVVVLYQ